MNRIIPVVLLLVFVVDLTAQETPLISPGTRVRVQVFTDTSTRDRSPFYRQSQWVVGSLVSLDVDSLVIKSAARDVPVTILRSHVGEFSVSQGRRLRGVSVLAGAIFGFFTHDAALSIYPKSDDFRAQFIPLGVLLGIIPSVVVGSLDTVGTGGRIGIGAATGASLGLFFGALVSSDPQGYTRMVGFLDGAFIGALAGAVTTRGERWESVRLPAHVGLFPRGGGYVALWFEFGK